AASASASSRCEPRPSSVIMWMRMEASWANPSRLPERKKSEAGRLARLALPAELAAVLCAHSDLLLGGVDLLADELAHLGSGARREQDGDRAADQGADADADEHPAQEVIAGLDAERVVDVVLGDHSPSPWLR